MPRLILASSSPRRKDLLGQIGIKPDSIEPVDIDETPYKAEDPRIYVGRMAEEKMDAAIKKFSSDFIITADTIVVAARNIIQKAETPDDVRASISLLSGRSHKVYTAVNVYAPEGKRSKKTVTTSIKVKRLTPQEIDSFVQSNEGLGKSGGYMIQGIMESFIKHIQGSYSSVVGLPLYETKTMLDGLGYVPEK